jgi:hypothetical protein
MEKRFEGGEVRSEDSFTLIGCLLRCGGKDSRAVR